METTNTTASTVEATETQQAHAPKTSTNPSCEQQHTSVVTNRYESQYAAITTISQEMRDYLALLGKLSDAQEVFYRLLSSNWGEVFAEKTQSKFSSLLYDAALEVEEWLKRYISDSLSLNCTEL